jgi:hypothetical protein
MALIYFLMYPSSGMMPVILYRMFKKCPWGPGSKQEIPLENLVPRGYAGKLF